MTMPANNAMTARRMEIVEISAGSLHLRPWADGDAAVVHQAYRDPTLVHWSPFGAVIVDEAAAAQWIVDRIRMWEFGYRAAFAVCDATSGAVVGAVELRGLETVDTGTASYWVLPSARGRGVAPRALAAVSRWAFADTDGGGLGLHRVELTHATGNTASCRVAQKAGYALEGTMRHSRRYNDGEYHDEHLHARIITD
jgi:RimJ/RimL family protein N-acetyltransferase